MVKPKIVIEYAYHCKLPWPPLITVGSRALNAKVVKFIVYLRGPIAWRIMVEDFDIGDQETMLVDGGVCDDLVAAILHRIPALQNFADEYLPQRVGEKMKFEDMYFGPTIKKL